MPPGHEPQWPDKIMAAALLVLIAGLLAVLHGVLVYADVSLADDKALFIYFLPAWWFIATGVLATTAGYAGYVHQSWLMTTLGILFAALSFGLLGASTLLAAMAIWPLVRSFQEGEETRLDRHRMHAHEWPDKAIMASVVLAAGGALALMQAMFLFLDRMAAPVLPERPLLWAALTGLAAMLALLGARDAFHLQRPGTAWIGSAAVLVVAPFYVIGIGFALAALAYLGFAHREAEFLLHRSAG